MCKYWFLNCYQLWVGLLFFKWYLCSQRCYVPSITDTNICGSVGKILALDVYQCLLCRTVCPHVCLGGWRRVYGQHCSDESSIVLVCFWLGFWNWRSRLNFNRLELILEAFCVSLWKYLQYRFRWNCLLGFAVLLECSHIVK